MYPEETTRCPTGTRDSALRNDDAVRLSLDAAWSRLIHSCEFANSGNATPASEKTTGQHEGTDTLPNTTAPRFW